jgi:hypothetical protein
MTVNSFQLHIYAKMALVWDTQDFSKLKIRYKMEYSICIYSTGRSTHSESFEVESKKHYSHYIYLPGYI